MLQRDDNIGSLERNIVTLAATLNPKPEIPEEARRHIIKAETLMKDAKQPSDYDEVIAEYGQVRLLAPWWPALWYNRAVVREAQGQYTNAIFCLNNYLLTKPSEADARTAQDKIYALEAEQEKAAKDKVREDAKARVEQITAVARQRLNSFEGMWHITHYEEGGQPSSTWGSKATDNVRIGKAGDDFDISGPTDQLGGSGYHLSGRTLRRTWSPTSREIEDLRGDSDIPASIWEQARPDISCQINLKLSEDGKTINVEYDGFTVNATRYRQLLVPTTYAYKGVERQPSFYKFTLTRIQ